MTTDNSSSKYLSTLYLYFTLQYIFISNIYSSYDLYAYIVPVCLLLMFNFGFSIWIMAVRIRRNSTY